tara:strand:+ start:1243 stop:1644 length:402 start_codon:yes stop_codon:yes gene_type:complete
MITIICKMTNSNLFENYWVPLICKHRDVYFIFADTRYLSKPQISDWSNVSFSLVENLEDVVEFAPTKVVYITVATEIPTYELMLRFRKPQPGLVPKIHNTNRDSKSFTVLRDHYQKETTCQHKLINDVTTYEI